MEEEVSFALVFIRPIVKYDLNKVIGEFFLGSINHEYL